MKDSRRKSAPLPRRYECLVTVGGHVWLPWLHWVGVYTLYLVSMVMSLKSFFLLQVS